MIIKIHGELDGEYIFLTSDDTRFCEWGSVVKVPVTTTFKQLEQIALWCKNTFNEDCLFEIVKEG